jgi:hypothetical protein
VFEAWQAKEKTTYKGKGAQLASPLFSKKSVQSLRQGLFVGVDKEISSALHHLGGALLCTWRLSFIGVLVKSGQLLNPHNSKSSQCSASKNCVCACWALWCCSSSLFGFRLG